MSATKVAAERRGDVAVVTLDEAVEGIAAFVDKPAPRFKEN